MSEGPTKTYILTGKHLGELLNLMSDLYQWITKGYEIRIDVYLQESNHEE
jgi:hypothetical protein